MKAMKSEIGEPRFPVLPDIPDPINIPSAHYTIAGDSGIAQFVKGTISQWYEINTTVFGQGSFSITVVNSSFFFTKFSAGYTCMYIM